MDCPPIAWHPHLGRIAVGCEVAAQWRTNGRVTDPVNLLARAGPHLEACSWRVRRVATDIQSGYEVAGSTCLTICGGAHQFALMLLAALGEGPRLQVRSDGGAIAVGPNHRAGRAP